MANVLWIDLETTGLEPAQTSILEVAAVVTNAQLEVLEKYSDVVALEPRHKLEMDLWCLKTHSNSGLLEACEQSRLVLRDIENKVIELIRRWWPDTEKPIIAGNSVHFDKAYIKQWMPELHRLLHYRIMDVTSLYLAQQIFQGKKFEKKEVPHRAMQDIMSSIELFKMLIR